MTINKFSVFEALQADFNNNNYESEFEFTRIEQCNHLEDEAVLNHPGSQPGPVASSASIVAVDSQLASNIFSMISANDSLDPVSCLRSGNQAHNEMEVPAPLMKGSNARVIGLVPSIISPMHGAQGITSTEGPSTDTGLVCKSPVPLVLDFGTSPVVQVGVSPLLGKSPMTGTSKPFHFMKAIGSSGKNTDKGASNEKLVCSTSKTKQLNDNPYGHIAPPAAYKAPPGYSNGVNMFAEPIISSYTERLATPKASAPLTRKMKKNLLLAGDITS